MKDRPCNGPDHDDEKREDEGDRASGLLGDSGGDVGKLALHAL
jgi:hypothetical protein